MKLLITTGFDFILIITVFFSKYADGQIDKKTFHQPMKPIPLAEEEDSLEQIKLTNDYKKFLEESLNEANNTLNIPGRINGRSVTLDLDNCIKEFAAYFASKENLRVDWSKNHMEEFRVSFRGINYGSATRVVSRPGSIYTYWVHNGKSTESMKGQFEKTIVKTNTFSWSKSYIMKAGRNLITEVNVPSIFSESINKWTEISLENITPASSSETETYSISQEITANPRTSVKAEWIINEMEMDVPWTIDIHFGGWIHIRFHEPYKGSYVWGFPLTVLREIYPSTFKTGSLGLVYTASGIFTGLRGTNSELKTYQYPY